MSDALKFAFEILVVGALALPWIVVLQRMFPETSRAGLDFDLSFVPKSVQGAVAAAAVIAFGYLLGSVISRISRDIFNDELFGNLPTENMIRLAVYNNEYCTEHLIRNMTLPFKPTEAQLHSFGLCPGSVPNDTPERFEARVTDLFRLQESALLLQGEDKVDRLKQYFDQINVLRGATLNSIILFMLCLFGGCGTLRFRWSERPVLKALTYLPAGAVVVFGVYSLIEHHIIHPEMSVYGDPPLAETVLILLGLGGLFVVAKSKEAVSYFRIGVVALVLTAVCYEAWWWTEVMYDIQVIHSHPEATQRPAPSSADNP
ncbi:MAG TPA: hypothetical protein VMU48_15640 [Terracidiphilus sp.]|nr:hypothetical protein [Terracidiphilus sp.]